MPVDKKEALRKYVESRIGAPAVSVCDNEKELLGIACELATGEYWTSVPYRTEYTIVNTSSTETFLDISTLKDNGFGSNTIKDEAYFLGILRYDFSDIFTRNYGSYNYFDYKLLGNKSNTYYPYKDHDPRYVADRIQRAVSEEDLVFGELEFYHDIVKDQLRIVSPDVSGSVQLYLGWGFSPSVTVDLVPFNHFNTFRKLVAFHFLESVISTRTAVTLEADYQINTSHLEKIRDELKEEYMKGLADISILPGVWG